MDMGLLIIGAIFSIPGIVMAVKAIRWYRQYKTEAEIVSVDPKYYGLQRRYQLTYRYTSEDGTVHEANTVHRWQPSKDTLGVLVNRENPEKHKLTEELHSYIIIAVMFFVMVLLFLLLPMLLNRPF